jgi:tRNA threonylcarbamoyladenosine biosynthesis protein TsaB
MSVILNIETSGKNCSVSVSDDEKILSVKEVQEAHFVHAEALHVLIKEAFIQAQILPRQIAGVAISEGPGSYTGLRIGLASAKGMAYSLGVPLLAISSLKIMTSAAASIMEADLYVPMIDARRMEVYLAQYSKKLVELSAAKALVVEGDFLEKDDDRKVVVFGDGAEKCLAYSGKAVYLPGVIASAKFMPALSAALYAKKQFVDLAYFEPAYLKSFLAGKPKSMF